MEIRYLIQDSRQSQSLSIENVAKKAEMAPGTLRAYEQGRRTPSAAAMKKLEKILGIQGVWMSPTTWSDPEGGTHEFAPVQGGRKRRYKPDLDSASEDSLRLLVIQKALMADHKTLEAMSHLLA